MNKQPLIHDQTNRQKLEGLRQEAWTVLQKIGQPQQGKEAQEAWDTMQENILSVIEAEIKKREEK